MKANEIIKTHFVSREDVERNILERNKDGYHTSYLPKDMNIDEGVISSLLDDGFKISLVADVITNGYQELYKIEW